MMYTGCRAGEAALTPGDLQRKSHIVCQEENKIPA
jgi:hypothetical protein